MTRLAAALTLAMGLGFGLVSQARAQGPDIHIVELDCNSNPELVAIQNGGDVAQDLTGWQLQSDPPEDEAFDLSVLEVLHPGESVLVQSGPLADGPFIWTAQFVLRDDDPSDYARITDDSGVVIDQVHCRGEAPPPTPAPSPTPSLEPSPEASPLADVPNGGGVPPPSGGVLSPGLMVVLGGSLLAIGLATFALPWLRSSPASLVGYPGTLAPQGEASVPSPARRPKGQRIAQGSLVPVGSGLALAGVTMTIAIALLSWRLRRRS